MVDLKLVPQALEYCVLEWRHPTLCLDLDKVVITAHNAQYEVIRESEIVVAIAHLVGRPLLPDHFGEVINLLLSNCLSV